MPSVDRARRRQSGQQQLPQQSHTSAGSDSDAASSSPDELSTPIKTPYGSVKKKKTQLKSIPSKRPAEHSSVAVKVPPPPPTPSYNGKTGRRNRRNRRSDDDDDNDDDGNEAAEADDKMIHDNENEFKKYDGAESSPDELDNDLRAFYRDRRQLHQERSGAEPGTPPHLRDAATDEGAMDDPEEEEKKNSSGTKGEDAQQSNEEAAHGQSNPPADTDGPPDDEDEDEDEDDQSMHTAESQQQSDTDSPPTPLPPPELTPAEKWRPWRLALELKGHRKGIAQVKISPDGRKIASCSADATVRIWDATSGKQLHVLQGHLAGISTIAWGPDSETLASGSDDKSIRLWNTETGRPYPNAFVGHHNYVYSIAFSPKGNMLVSGSYDEAVFLWDVRNAKIMKSLPAHSDPVGGVDFVRDGTLIVSCAGDGLIRIWDTATGQCLRTLVQEERQPVTSVVFSPNGKYVLAWTLDSCLRLWDYVEGRCVKTYQGHQNAKYSIGGVFGVYGPDQKDVFVATGSEDGRIVFWDITTKEILQSIDAHQGVVLGLDTSIGRNLLVSGGIDGTVQLWELDVDTTPVGENGLDDADEMDVS